jgi:CubicO group peptidase (beta-lactamase class C family)
MRMRQWIMMMFAFALGLSPSGAMAHGQAAADSEPLIGLWAYQHDYAAAARGPLVLRRSGGRWRAAIGGAEASAAAGSGEDIRLAFGDRGGFRGRLADDGRTISGFWLQPANGTGSFNQPFATPVSLRREGTDTWRGTAFPLDESFTLYLSVFRDAQGALTAAFRNPERNSNGGASRFEVSREGDAVRFVVRFEGGEIAHQATLLRDPDRIRIAWPDLGRTIELTRRDPAHARSFFPRPPGSPPYVYRRPPETGDGWRTGSAGDQGIDEAALAGAVQTIIDSDPTARPATLMHSMLVAHRGRLVLEEYFFGHDRDTPHDTRSAGKTFSSVMLGAAMMEGAPVSPETRIYSLLAARGPFANPDPRKDRITLSHLMTHSAGFACNDYDEASPGYEDRMSNQTAQPDWWKYTLDLPMAFDPGVRYAYCSANINLVGAALTIATRTWLPEYFARTVAEPLQFGRWHWNLMPTGEGYIGGGAHLRPRDLLKIGQAYLDGGVWNGRRIVPADWVTASTAPRIEITPATTGYSEEEFGNNYGGGADALAWHMSPLTVGGRTVAGYAATGNGGQVLLVIPEYDLTVVFTGGNYGQGGVWGRWGQQIVGDRIIPAIRR